jgi:hypothetical protein
MAAHALQVALVQQVLQAHLRQRQHLMAVPAATGARVATAGRAEAHMEFGKMAHPSIPWLIFRTTSLARCMQAVAVPVELEGRVAMAQMALVNRLIPTCPVQTAVQVGTAARVAMGGLAALRRA